MSRCFLTQYGVSVMRSGVASALIERSILVAGSVLRCSAELAVKKVSSAAVVGASSARSEPKCCFCSLMMRTQERLGSSEG